jgi:hypothetical protein
MMWWIVRTVLIVAALIALGCGATADDQQHAGDKGQTQEVKEVKVPAYTVDERVKMGPQREEVLPADARYRLVGVGYHFRNLAASYVPLADPPILTDALVIVAASSTLFPCYAGY